MSAFGDFDYDEVTEFLPTGTYRVVLDDIDGLDIPEKDYNKPAHTAQILKFVISDDSEEDFRGEPVEGIWLNFFDNLKSKEDFSALHPEYKKKWRESKQRYPIIASALGADAGEISSYSVDFKKFIKTEYVGKLNSSKNTGKIFLDVSTLKIAESVTDDAFSDDGEVSF